jgi:hypothetical protein
MLKNLKKYLGPAGSNPSATYTLAINLYKGKTDIPAAEFWLNA